MTAAVNRLKSGQFSELNGASALSEEAGAFRDNQALMQELEGMKQENSELRNMN